MSAEETNIEPTRDPGATVLAGDNEKTIGLDPTKASLSGESIETGEQILLGPEPTEEEIATLRKVTDKLPFSAFFVVIVELAERFTYYGLNGVFQNYMQIPRTSTKQTGGLGMGQSSATALSQFFQFWCYVTPIPAAIIADMWLGKYNTIFWFTLIYILGNLVLFTTSLPVSIEHGHAEGGLIAAMVIIGIGTGGIKANVSTLVADQYTNTRPYVKTLKSGERVIVDPDATMTKIFMIFYWAINVGSLSAIATTELEKNVDFWAAYLLPFCFFFIALITLVLGRNYYIRRPAQGSPIPRAFRIIFIAVWNGLKRDGYRSVYDPTNDPLYGKVRYNKFERQINKVPEAAAKLFKNFNLDIARPAVRQELGLSPVPWDDAFVNQVYRSLVACKVFLFYPIYWIVYGQMLNNFVSQAGTMETHGIPNDIMQNIDPIAIIIFIPIMDYLVYPTLRKWGFHMYPMTRIFLGFLIGAVAMAYAAIVQHIIYTSPPCYEYALACDASDGGNIPNKVHVAVQTPAYFFIALSEIFALITGYEYAYTKAPPSMKSFIMSLFLLTNAIGSAIAIALSPTAKNPHLMWMYISLAIAAAIAGCFFWVFYSQYNRVEEYLNRIDQEEREGEIAARKFGGDHDPMHNATNDILHPDHTHSSTPHARQEGADGFEPTEQAMADSRINANS